MKGIINKILEEPEIWIKEQMLQNQKTRQEVLEELKSLLQEFVRISKRRRQDCGTLLVNIQEEDYPISYEVLYRVFSPFGNLEDITIFESGAEFHSRICYEEGEAAVQAIEALQDRYVYEGCCQLKLALASEVSCPNAAPHEIGNEKKSYSLIGNKARSNAYKVFDEMSERARVEVTHKESGLHGKEVIDHPIQHKLEAVKKIRSYISISSDEIFEKWERGLCELCDEPFSLGHKCKKISSKYIFHLVDEEEETISNEKCPGQCSQDDALQVFDENPKRNRSIKPVEWLREDKENMQADFSVVTSEQLDQLNPSSGVLKKPAFMSDNEPNSKVQQEQKFSAQHLFDEMPKRVAFTISNKNHEDEEDNIQRDKMKTSKELVECHFFDELAKGNWRDLNHYVFDEINQISNKPVWLSFEFNRQSITSLKFYSVEANLGLLFTRSHTWEWNVYSWPIPFDPGGMQCVSNWLPTNIHTIHNLEAISVVFDPGKLDLLVNGGVVAIMVGHSITTTESAEFLVVWLIENHATYKLEIVIVVFDPGGKVINKGGHKVSYLMLSFMEGVAWHLLRSRNPVLIE